LITANVSELARVRGPRLARLEWHGVKAADDILACRVVSTTKRNRLWVLAKLVDEL